MRGILQKDNLDKKILREEGDFTPQDYAIMEGYISTLLEHEGIEVSPQTAGNWLRGQTLAPRDWKVFEVLENHLNPAFHLFQPHDQNPSSIYFNYRFYVVMRQMIMRELNKYRGTAEPGHESASDNSFIALNPELNIVLQHFLHDRGDKYATVRVNAIEELHKGKQKSNPRLSTGVVVKTIASLEKRLKATPEAYYDLQLLKDLFDLTVLDYIQSDQTSELDPLISELPSIVLSDICTRYGLKIHPRIKKESPLDPANDPYQQLKKYSARTVDDIFTGNFETALAIKRGTILRLLESIVRLENCVPSIVDAHYAIFQPPSKTSDLLLEPSFGNTHTRRKLQKKGFKVNHRGSIQSGDFFSDILELYFVVQDKLQGSPSSIRTLLQQGKISHDDLTSALTETKGHSTLRTREQTERVLEEYHLQDLLFVCEPDFIWETLI